MLQISKKSLAIILSRLKAFEDPKVGVEQYSTDPEIAAEVLVQAAMQGDIKNKEIADFGAGSGILSLGAALMGAKKVYAIESESSAAALFKINRGFLETNYPEVFSESKVEMREQNIMDFDLKVDCVIQNPPFGTKKVHQDIMFLDKAIRCADIIYSFHKSSTIEYLEKYIDKNGFKITHKMFFDFPIKKTMKFHQKPKKLIKVVVLRIEKR